jgi:N-acetylglucosamine-6-phosphate deacetylase
MTSNQKIFVINGKFITPYRIIENGCLFIENGVIVELSEFPLEIISGAKVIDAEGRYVAPGFIDIHVHGGGGADFMDGTEDAFRKIAQTHARHGTTAMCPTTLTADKETILKSLSAYSNFKDKSTGGACFLGMHLEGPYFAMSQRGAQDPRFIRNPDPAEYNDIINKSSGIARWSAAPELPGAIEFGRAMRKKNILPAIAHTDALYSDVITAFENGYTLATHLYSSMSGVTRRNAFRYAGVIESAFLIDEMDVEIIADGAHLPPPLLQMIYKIKGPEHIALITDAMRAAGLELLPTEKMMLSGLEVIIEDGVAKLSDRSSFAGSIATADRLVRNMVKIAHVSLPDAIRMMTSTPARIMKADTKGALVTGKDADVVIFDENINISLTMVGGEIVFDTADIHK